MDIKQQLKSLRQYQKQYNKILAKIEQYEDKLYYATENTRDKYIDKIDWLNDQATELENIIFQYQKELRLYYGA